MSRATLDMFSLACFDYKVGSLDSENHELVSAINNILRPRAWSPLFYITIRLLNKFSILENLPFPAIKAAEASMSLMQQEAKNMLGKKLEMVQPGEVEGQKDLLSCIVKANKLATSEKDKMEDDEVSSVLL